MNKKYNLVNFCEFDKYAIKSYCAIHGIDESLNLGDITKVEKLPKCDFLTYGFPCQDISMAGLQAGIKKGNRSGLLFEVERLLELSEYKPKFLLMENVKNLLGKKHKDDFDRWLIKLENLGYNNYYNILNAKDYGIPQNRERIFCLSIRKDIDKGFKFPSKIIDETLNFRRMLEPFVDEKYFLTDNDLKKVKGFGANYSFGGYLSNNLIYNTITKSYGKVTGNSMKFMRNNKISYLTPLETFRLMGFDDYDFDKCDKAINDFKTTDNVKEKEKYARAGNSIVVDVLFYIYKQIQKYYPNDFKTGINVVTLFSGIGAFEKALDRLFEDINKGE